jgi:hypothetical protein
MLWCSCGARHLLNLAIWSLLSSHSLACVGSLRCPAAFSFFFPRCSRFPPFLLQEELRHSPSRLDLLPPLRLVMRLEVCAMRAVIGRSDICLVLSHSHYVPTSTPLSIFAIQIIKCFVLRYLLHVDAPHRFCHPPCFSHLSFLLHPGSGLFLPPSYI